ncbi:MAG: hypothetical protein M9949_11815 [Candidatus Kapabacteria bacterium]|nr:hypothetical protein [Candidatus Kapabacteria bacterium]
MKRYILILLSVAFIMSCEDSSTQHTAQLMQLDNLVRTPGYSWFDIEYNAYEPNQQMLDEIKNNFDPQIHKFLVFLKPACSCPGTHKLFPAFVKGADLSGIPDANIEYYSMRSNRDAYHYSDLFTLNELPAFIILKNGQPIYSITDTMLTKTSIEYELNPNFPVELFIEDALKNY